MQHAKSTLSLIIGLLLNCTHASAVDMPVEKPKSMDDMWKIIQAQQQQIDSMTKKLEQATNKATPTGTEKTEVKALEYKTNVLTEEVEKLRTELVVPEKVEYKSAYGMGPAASKVYQSSKGLSIGGYGEGHFQAPVKDKGGRVDGNLVNPASADLERMVLYVGYKFTDSILFNSELEYEHASSGEGSEQKGEVSVEFASLDFFIHKMLNVRAGMVLLPMGFINQIHEPPFYFGNNRPLVETKIIPSTWHENGVGLFGELLPNLTYTTYVVNGLNARNFSADGIRSGRQDGSLALAEDLAYVGRLDYAPASLPGISFGGSAYVGNSGQNQLFNGVKADVLTQLYEAHVQWKYRGLEFRTLGAFGSIGNAALLSAANNTIVGAKNYGWYSEIGYDILPHLISDTSQYLAPFFRYEQLDTLASLPVANLNNLSKYTEIYQIGMNYKPIPNVVIKADYRNFVQKTATAPADFNLGVGFIF